MLGGAFIEREGQKRLCPKNEINWDSSCMKHFKDVELRFLFLRYIDGFYYKDRGGFPFLKSHSFNSTYSELPDSPNDVVPPVHHILTDSCIHMKTRDCLEIFLN